MTYQEWYSLMVIEGWELVAVNGEDDDTEPYGEWWMHETAGTKSGGRFVCKPEDSEAYWRAGMTPPPF